MAYITSPAEQVDRHPQRGSESDIQPTMRRTTNVDVFCLGVGKGTSYVMRGKPSTSFAIRIEGQPALLIDCGAGIGLSCLRNLDGIIPSVIYISHNHLDHTGDLPVVVGFTREKPRLLGHAAVLKMVKEHRFHDSEVIIENIDEIADWVEADMNNIIGLERNLSLHLFKSVHSYLCYGFVLKKDGQDILSYSADSAFNEDLYLHITRAPIAIVDGRDQGNHDHASFADIDRFAERVPDCCIWVVHYEETVYRFSSPNVRLMREGDVIAL